MNITMDFPDTPEQFLSMYSFTDTKEYYTNGQQCITLHRVGQMLEHYFAERTCKQVCVTDKCLPYVTHITICSLCREILAFDEYPAPNYCPNCGAKVVR